MTHVRLVRTASALLAAALLVSAPAAARAQLTTPLADDQLDAFTWRSVGPSNMSGRVTDVEGLPSPSKTFYVASAAGGVWKTTNNGTTFQLVWDGNGRVISMGDIGIAPSDPEQVWLGTGEEDSRNSISPGGGIFKSTDGGATWEAKGLEATQAIARIVVHPTNPDVVYVAALGHVWGSNPERGVYRTRNGGDSWELVKFVGDGAGFSDVALDPRDPDVVWAASWERVRGPYYLQSGGPGSALWKSTDGGDSWAEVEGNGFPTATKGRIGLAISASRPDVMYALVEAEEEADGSGGNGLYRSDDAGRTWSKKNDVNTRPFYYSQVRVDPQDPDRVYFSSTPVQFSDDGGETYGSTTNDVHVDHHAMWIDPNDPERIVVGNDGGAAISYDRGGNWSVLNHFAIGQFYDVSYNMDTPYRVCGGLQDNGTWCAPSRVEDGAISRYHWATVSGGDGFVSAQDPVDSDLMWSESQGGNIGRSRLSTGERTGLDKPDWEDAWRVRQDSIVLLIEDGVGTDEPQILRLKEDASRDSANAVMRYNWNTPFFQSAHERSWFYAAGNRVLKSTNWGDDLEIISPDLSWADPEKIRVSTETTGGVTPDVTGAETFATVTALEESPLRRGLLYAGTDDGRVWMTADDGGSWTELTDRIPGVPEGTYVTRLTASHHDPQRVYVTFDNHRRDDLDPYVLVSDDGARSFRSIASNLPTGGVDFLHVITEDPHNPNLLFVGSDVGAYVSTDRGGSWQRFMEGMPTVPVHDLEVHPRDRELIAATHGRSLWIVDIAALEGLTDRVMADGAALLPSTPAFQFGSPARGGESTGQQWFSRPTPGSRAEITYWIGEDVSRAIAEASEDTGNDQGAGAGSDTGNNAGARPSGRAGRPSDDNPMGRNPRGPQVDIRILAPDGSVFREMKGPGGPGIHTVTWDFRGAAPEPEEPSPSQRRDRERMAERGAVVRDSLVAEGWDAQMLDRMVGVITGTVDRQQAFGMFGGRGGGGGGDPEAFRERPGESMGGGGGFDFGRMREVAELVNPGGGLGSLFRGGGGQAPLAEPGTYSVRVDAAGRMLSGTLEVVRVGDFAGDGSGFGEDTEEWMERIR